MTNEELNVRLIQRLRQRQANAKPRRDFPPTWLVVAAIVGIIGLCAALGCTTPKRQPPQDGPPVFRVVRW